MQVALREVQQRIDTAFIYVTHDQEEAFSMSDRVAVMDHGRVAQVAPPREIYHRPQSLYVARFVGSSNALNGTVRQIFADGSYMVEVDGLHRAHCGGVAGLSEGDRVLVVARPEAAAAPMGEQELVVSGLVRDVSFLGPQTNYVLDVPRVGDVRVQAPAAGWPGSPGEGDRASVAWPFGSLWVVPHD